DDEPQYDVYRPGILEHRRDGGVAVADCGHEGILDHRHPEQAVDEQHAECLPVHPYRLLFPREKSIGKKQYDAARCQTESDIPVDRYRCMPEYVIRCSTADSPQRSSYDDEEQALYMSGIFMQANPSFYVFTQG